MNVALAPGWRRPAARAVRLCRLVATMSLLIAAAPLRAQDFVVEENAYTFGQAPDWMPDGARVVHHAADDDGTNQIWTANLDGSGEQCLTCGQPGPNMVPDSRPQGDVVLFHSWRGTNIKLGAPGFGGLGSDLYVVPASGGDAVALTADHDGYDNYHAYFSPDGSKIVWTRLDWNFVTSTGRGYWDIRVADYVDDAPGPRLKNVRVVHEGPGHYFETQHWSPDGCGFLFTESVDTTLNLELFYLDLCKAEDDPTRIRRLTSHPAWDEQAIFTPDMTKVIFMSTRDHPSAWNTWASAFWSAGTPADADHLLILPLFEAGFLQPIAGASNDLYELDFANPSSVRRLTRNGDDGWIIPEFVWDPAGGRLLWTEAKYDDGVRMQLPPNPARDAGELAVMLQDPPLPEGASAVGLTPQFLLHRRTMIGSYAAED
jgi:Tol biopolymer transport system component